MSAEDTGVKELYIKEEQPLQEMMKEAVHLEERKRSVCHICLRTLVLVVGKPMAFRQYMGMDDGL